MKATTTESGGQVAEIFTAAAIVRSAGYKLAGKADDHSEDHDDGYTIALFGDTPYSALGKSPALARRQEALEGTAYKESSPPSRSPFGSGSPNARLVSAKVAATTS